MVILSSPRRWTCPRCGAGNYGVDHHCTRCGQPDPERVTFRICRGFDARLLVLEGRRAAP